MPTRTISMPLLWTHAFPIYTLGYYLATDVDSAVLALDRLDYLSLCRSTLTPILLGIINTNIARVWNLIPYRPI